MDTGWTSFKDIQSGLLVHRCVSCVYVCMEWVSSFLEGHGTKQCGVCVRVGGGDG